MAELTDKQQAFVTAYLLCGFNGTEAARRVSPKAKRPDQLAYEYLRKPEIAEAIRAGLAQHGMPADEVIARLADQARGTMADFLYIGDEEITIDIDERTVDQDGGLVKHEKRVEKVTRPVARLDLKQAAERGKLHLVKKYALSDKGAVSLELYDARAALELIGKHQGLFKDDPLVNLNLTPEQLAELSDDELDALHAKLSSLTRRR